MTTPDTNSRFSGEQLNAAERKLLDASLTGALVDLQAGDARLDDPAQAAAWRSRPDGASRNPGRSADRGPGS